MAIEMTNTDISRRLALAIGYAPQNVRVDDDGVVEVLRADEFGWYWMPFSHSNERTIFRIAARYDLFPHWSALSNKWVNPLIQTESGCCLLKEAQSDCPATCIALAVIEASERGLLS